MRGRWIVLWEKPWLVGSWVDVDGGGGWDVFCDVRLELGGFREDVVTWLPRKDLDGCQVSKSWEASGFEQSPG